MWVVLFPGLPGPDSRDLLVVHADEAITEDIVTARHGDIEGGLEEITDKDIEAVYPNIFRHIATYFVAYNTVTYSVLGRPVPSAPNLRLSGGDTKAYLLRRSERLRRARRYLVPVKPRSTQDLVFVANVSPLNTAFYHVDVAEVTASAVGTLDQYVPVGIRYDLLTRFCEGLADIQTLSQLKVFDLTDVSTSEALFVPSCDTMAEDVTQRQHIASDGTVFEDLTQCQCLGVGPGAALRSTLTYCGRLLVRRDSHQQQTQHPSTLKPMLFGGGPSVVYSLTDSFDQNHVAVLTSTKNPERPFFISRDLGILNDKVVQYFFSE